MSASAAATTIVSVAASGTAAPSASGSVANGGHPPTCEVEIFGEAKLPKDAPKGKLVVYVAQDDCMSEQAHTLGHIPAGGNGSFVIEVFPKWGTDVTLCAALEPDAGGAAEWYGKATNKDGQSGGKFHAEAIGEVTFTNVAIDLKKGPSHKFPREDAK